MCPHFLLTEILFNARINNKMKEDREMSCCEDGDPYPFKIDGNREYLAVILPAVGVSRTGS